MPRTREELEARIDASLIPGFRGRLVARGLARSLIWSEGLVPDGATEFAAALTPDLLGYGLALFRIGLELRSLDRRNATAAKAFERAAEAIEAVIKDGYPEWEDRGLYTVIAATAYHLGHFSARAFSLFPADTDPLNLSSCEEALTCLLLRDMQGLRDRIFLWSNNGGFDESLAQRFTDQGSELSFDSAFVLAQDSLFHQALAWFDYGLESGDNAAIGSATRLLIEGANEASELGSVPYWWIFTIARHLIDDLWDFSLHVHLPDQPLDDAPSSRWRNLRWLFIALLEKRHRAEIDLWPSQLSAAARAIDVTDDLVAALPTSAGKTRIAEICILRTLSLGHRVIFVTPLRALSAQTERTLRQTFTPLGFTVSSLYGSSGSTGDDVDSLKNRSIVVSTPEKLDFALRNDPSLIENVGLVVLDEAHTIGMGEREVRYEVLVQRLLRRPDAAQRRIVCLSAILPQGPQLNDFVGWVRQDQPGDAISCDWRPTRQRFGEITWDGKRAVLTFTVEDEKPYVNPFFQQRPPEGKTKPLFPKKLNEIALASVWQLIEEEQTVLLYSPQRNWVIPIARAVVELHRKNHLKSLLTENPDVIQDAVNIGTEWLGQFHPAVECLKLGVAVHHAQLPRPFLRAIEQLLRSGKLKVTIASPTLAQGLNLSATTVLFYGLTRSGVLIPGEEFANVAGRAGRAFVDVEGRVLGLISAPGHRSNWDKLLRTSRERDLRSGLARLIWDFCNRISINRGIASTRIAEFIMGDARAWEAPSLRQFRTQKAKDRIAEQEAFNKKWQSDVASLDSAILSIAQHDTSVETLAAEIDNALIGSLWTRTLAHQSDETKGVVRSLLLGRAKFLWSKTTPSQRKSYFFAGVGFKTGQFLDANGEKLSELLSASDESFSAGDVDRAVIALIAFAEIIFQIEPFRPENLLPNWKVILSAWVNGIDLSDLSGGQEEETIEMIEGAFVYRLVWGLEAMRVRNAAYKSEAEELPEAGRAALAVETGTHSISAALLIQAGVPSRVAAVKAVRDCAASFDTLKGLRRWLSSQRVQDRLAEPNWPTTAMHGPWRQFVSSLSSSGTAVWSTRSANLQPAWTARVPAPKTPVRILHDAKISETVVYSIELNRLGTIVPCFACEPAGVITAVIGNDGRSLDCTYTGPSDISLDTPPA